MVRLGNIDIANSENPELSENDHHESPKKSRIRRKKKKRKMMMMPPWLRALLSESKFFSACDDEGHASAKKNERNIFCLDCRQAICQHCLPSHSHLHKLLQIRRYVYHDVVRIEDIHDLIDCSLVQPYIINSAKVVFLNARPQPRPIKGPGCNLCEHCERNLQDPYKYCSMGCKVEAVMKREGGLRSILQYAKGFGHHESIHDDLIESLDHCSSLQQINDMVSTSSRSIGISNKCNIIGSRSSYIDRCSSSHNMLTALRSARHKDDGDIDSAAEYIADCDDAEGGGGDGADDIDDGDQDQQEQLSPNTVLNSEVINASTSTNSSTSTVNARRHHDEADHFAWAMSTAISAAVRGAPNHDDARSSTNNFRHDHRSLDINYDYIDEAVKIMKMKKPSKKKQQQPARAILWSDSCALIPKSAASHHPQHPPPPNFCISNPTFVGTSCAHVYTNRRKRSMLKPRRSPIL